MIGPGGCPSTGQCEDYLGTRGHGGTIYSARWSVVCQVVGRVAGPTCLPRTCSPVCSAQSSAAQHHTSHHPALPRVLASWARQGACVNTVIAPMLIVNSVEGVYSVDRGSPHVDTGISWSQPGPGRSPAPGPGSHRSVCWRVLHRQHLASTVNTGEQ